jgi:molybdenum cofactor cytidylyltransferase
MATKANSPCVIVLASGRGERFIAAGGTGPKLQAPLAGKPLLERTLDAVRASGLPWRLEDVGHPGMGDSIAAAVRAIDAVADLVVDDVGIVTDIDTPEALAAAEALWLARSTGRPA